MSAGRWIICAIGFTAADRMAIKGELAARMRRVVVPISGFFWRPDVRSAMSVVRGRPEVPFQGRQGSFWPWTDLGVYSERGVTHTDASVPEANQTMSR
jgi:hypothetical protein